eukprot:m.297368 g.297368  ORF g.297368 m.297368 type:complete len:266 (-) comp16399_c0_seq1:1134-1931(-)
MELPPKEAPMTPAKSPGRATQYTQEEDTALLKFVQAQRAAQGPLKLGGNIFWQKNIAALNRELPRSRTWQSARARYHAVIRYDDSGYEKKDTLKPKEERDQEKKDKAEARRRRNQEKANNDTQTDKEKESEDTKEKEKESEDSKEEEDEDEKDINGMSFRGTTGSMKHNAKEEEVIKDPVLKLFSEDEDEDDVAPPRPSTEPAKDPMDRRAVFQFLFLILLVVLGILIATAPMWGGTRKEAFEFRPFDIYGFFAGKADAPPATKE